MNDFLAFRKMLTPVFIQALFWIGLLGVVIYAFSMTDNFLATLLAIAFGAAIWRVYCEILIVIFRINDTLADIRRSVGGESAAPES